MCSIVLMQIVLVLKCRIMMIGPVRSVSWTLWEITKFDNLGPKSCSIGQLTLARSWEGAKNNFFQK